MTLLLAGVEFDETDAGYAKLIEAARETQTPLDEWRPGRGNLQGRTGRTSWKANNALVLSDQIGPILASGTKGNPRQIKRFLNTLLLREHSNSSRLR